MGRLHRSEYETRRDDILRQLETFAPKQTESGHLDRLAQFLGDVPAAWAVATQEQRNELGRALFDQVWLEDKVVVAVKPRPELEPFFRLNYEAFIEQNIEGSGSRRVELHPERDPALLIPVRYEAPPEPPEPLAQCHIAPIDVPASLTG